MKNLAHGTFRLDDEDDEILEEMDEEMDEAAHEREKTCERPGSLTGLVKGRLDAQNGAIKRGKRFAQ